MTVDAAQIQARVAHLQGLAPVVMRVRGGACRPTALVDYPRCERASWSMVSETVVTRVSMRKVQRIATEPYSTRMSAIPASRIGQGPS